MSKPPNSQLNAIPDDMNKSDDGSGTGTLGKAISVLDIIANSSMPLRFTDVLKFSDQPRGTLHRQISNLIEEGLITVNRDNSYALGLRLLQFASKAWAGNEFRGVAAAHIQQLHEATGETVHLGVLKGIEVIYLDKIESRQNIRMVSQIGNTAPAFCTGVGKAALSALPDNELHKRISNIEFRRYTPNTLTTAAALLAEIDTIRRTGNAYDREEHETGITCVAAPILSHTDRLFTASVSVTGPAYRVTPEMLVSWAEITRNTASAITSAMTSQLAPRS
ncbi:IclR family transcriptional regulator [Phyllobacterium sp. YR531]|uniref:IclR family transcriptional regulator n=1 Tax=Phyllobacterium sp. YR531 TaxID=1144343 RepID=UPI001FCC8D3F|nr:IclR family transcriptional regulator [Phyllobacterium sp. YR531]